MDAVTLPETVVGATVPVIVPLIEQPLHARPEKGMENAPLLLTAVVPEDVGAVQPGGFGGWLLRGTRSAVTA